MKTTTYPSRPDPTVSEDSKTRNQGRQVDFTKVGDSFRVGAKQVVVGTGGAAANATSVPVEALTAEIPAGTTLDFGAKKYATTTAIAAIGAVVLAVRALATALVAGDATYVGGENNKKRIPAYTVMAELSSGKVIPRRDVTGAETAAYMIETDAQEGGDSLVGGTDSLSGYGMLTGAHVHENLLPDADKTTGLLPSGWKTELRANGGTWLFDTYGDTR